MCKNIGNRNESKVYNEKFNNFVSTYHFENDISLVPCHGFETLESQSKEFLSSVTSHNEFLRKITVMVIYNLKGVRIPIQMDGTITTLTEELSKATEVDGKCLITDISEINSREINVITSIEPRVKVKKAIYNFLDH